MPHSPAPPTPGRNLAFGSVVAGGGFILLLLAGAAFFAGSLLEIEAIMLPARVGLAIGVVWFVAARLARVGRSL